MKVKAPSYLRLATGGGTVEKRVFMACMNNTSDDIIGTYPGLSELVTSMQQRIDSLFQVLTEIQKECEEKRKEMKVGQFRRWVASEYGDSKRSKLLHQAYAENIITSFRSQFSSNPNAFPRFLNLEQSLTQQQVQNPDQ